MVDKQQRRNKKNPSTKRILNIITRKQSDCKERSRERIIKNGVISKLEGWNIRILEYWRISG